MSGRGGGPGNPSPADAAPASEERALRVSVGRSVGEVSAVLSTPPDPRALLVLAHGAGAGMRHPFMEAVASALGERRIATFRYRFPYMEAGRRRPDPPRVLTATVGAAVATAAEAAPGLPLLAGGKSMGGRMTSQAAAAVGDATNEGPGTAPTGDAGVSSVRGIVFFGFPLHPAKRPGTERATHLSDVRTPMLFLQGTRDALADLELLRPVCERLGSRARLHVVEGADHGFHVLKRSGRTDEEVLEELADVTAEWTAEVTAS